METYSGKMADVQEYLGHFSFELDGRLFVASDQEAQRTLRRLQGSVVTLLIDDADPVIGSDRWFIELFAATHELNTFRVLLGP